MKFHSTAFTSKFSQNTSRSCQIWVLVVKLFDTDNNKPRMMWHTIFMTTEATKNLTSYCIRAINNFPATFWGEMFWKILHRPVNIKFSKNTKSNSKNNKLSLSCCGCSRYKHSIKLNVFLNYHHVGLLAYLDNQLYPKV